MWAYTLRRILYGVPILLGVSIIVFALVQLAPGDAATLLIPPEAPKEVADQIRAKLGLDKPVYVQYVLWLGRLVRGDLGALAAFNRGTVLDRIFSGTAITGVSLPHYWVGIVLVALFAVVWNVLPAQGMGPSGFPRTWAQFRHMILPVVTLSLIPMGVVSRLVRANVL